MGTSAIGWSKKNKGQGFTLIEVMLVLVILVVLTGLISIRIEGVLSGGDLRLASRIIIGEITSLRGKAAATRREQILILDVDDDTLAGVDGGAPEEKPLELSIKKKSFPQERDRPLPKGVDLEDVVLFPEGKIQEGEARVRFFVNGCVERALIHLRNEANEVYTLEVNPLTGKVKLYDRYVEQRFTE
ncbi:MAG: prepilin-type N-terminal cleavage/methylation domain-containing protein [Deltaproteobacteria bacterium]|nr:prepilin-type N-terminal cleavage/methylation domain-containing protein [Deltaproteobacteria bacterium]